MLRRLALALLFVLAVPTLAAAQAAVSLYCWNPSGTSGGNFWLPCNSTTPLQTTVSGTVTATQGNAGSSAWLVQLAGQSFTNITTNTDTNVKASAGTFVGITVNTGGTTSTAKIYNDADGTCSSGLIATVNTTALVSLTFNAAATTGICVTTAGAAAADITILWR